MQTLDVHAAAQEQETWSRHHAFLKSVPARAAHRGCVGLAVAADGANADSWIVRGGQTFVPDRDLRWFVLQDLPAGRRRAAARSEARMASVLRTTLQYGMPRLGPDVAARFDHGSPAAAAAQPHWIRVFNRISLAMTALATRRDRTWQEARRAAVAGGDALALPPVEETPPRPSAWFPAAYLAFPEAAAERLWGRVFQGDLGRAPIGLRRAFLADVAQGMPVRSPAAAVVERIDARAAWAGRSCAVLTLATAAGPLRLPAAAATRFEVRPGDRVESGQVLGRGGPAVAADWDRQSLTKRWRATAPDLFRGRWEWHVRLWFLQQQVRLQPGLVHLPAALAAPAALGSAVDEALCWEVSAGFDHFDEEADAFVFPPVLAKHWDRFRLSLTDDIDFDVLPRDPKLM